MTVIEFRPRPRAAPDPDAGGHVPVAGRFRSPRGRMGRLDGSLRVQRLVVVREEAYVTGVVTGELRDSDGSLVGLDSRRVTAAADLVREHEHDVPVVRPFELDLMGLTVQLDSVRIGALPATGRSSGEARSARRRASQRWAVRRP